MIRLPKWLGNGLERLRQSRFIDGPDKDAVEEITDATAQKQMNYREALLKKVLENADALMQEHFSKFPSGTIIAPRKFVVYFDKETDKQWTGTTRNKLKNELATILLDRAKEKAGGSALDFDSIIVEIRIDGTLEDQQFRVRQYMDENDEPTEILDKVETDDDPTELLDPPSPDAITLFTVEVRHDDEKGKVQQSTIPFTKPEISIGRGSKDIKMDLPLKEDINVSRNHATIRMDEKNRFWVTDKGSNPLLLNGKKITRNTPHPVAPGQKIKICSYTLVIQPLESKKSSKKPTRKSPRKAATKTSRKRKA